MDTNNSFEIWKQPITYSYPFSLPIQTENSYIHSPFMIPYQNIVQKNRELQEQVQDLKRQNIKLVEKLKKNKPKRRYSQRRTDLTKDFECPYEACSNIYSSRIALNLHLKKKHGKKAVKE